MSADAQVRPQVVHRTRSAIGPIVLQNSFLSCAELGF